jgi:hypothetical protein
MVEQRPSKSPMPVRLRSPAPRECSSVVERLVANEEVASSILAIRSTSAASITHVDIEKEGVAHVV